MTTKITEQNISNLANAGVNWQPVVTADGSTGLTAVAGRGYFIDTTSGAQTVTLPASPNVGDVVVLKDYARTWGTNNVTIASTLVDGGTSSPSFSTSGQTVTLVRMDNTKGWSIVNEDTTTNLNPAFFTAATGGTVTESGDFKIHTFTGDGCFVVSALGNAPINPTGGPTTVDYLVVAGGGGGGGGIGGGGGAGGFREGKSSPAPSYTASPLVAPTGITVSTTTYPITVGAGGIGTGGGGGGGIPGPTVPTVPASTSGSPSIFSTITSTGGGYGRHYGSQPTPTQSAPGGSGGGGSGNVAGTGGTGNTPPTSPSQGNTGSDGNPSPPWQAGGGGGATAIGSAYTPSGSGPGGAGATTSISGSPTAYAGGGGGGGPNYGAPGGGTGGTGGGGTGQPSGGSGSSGTTNRGGGGGGGSQTPGGDGQRTGYNGGSGIVIIRYKFQ